MKMIIILILILILIMTINKKNLFSKKIYLVKEIVHIINFNHFACEQINLVYFITQQELD